MASRPLDGRDAPLLDIFAAAVEPPRSGWLAWGFVAGAVALAGLAVTAEDWTMSPSRGHGAGAFEPATAAPPPAAQAPPERAPSGTTGGPGDREATPPASPELAALVAELPASWRMGVPFAPPEAHPWTMPDLPFLEAAAPPMPFPGEPEPEPPAAPPAEAGGAAPTPVPNRARRPSASARTAKEPPSKAAGNTARCRDAVAAAQIGENLSRANLTLMRARCAE